ncbi:nitrile-specifier protein 2 [Chaetomidium leptoderma]|uniref:Nitrile-specifier protein 2 n=1 Tax=Chaetomidium leptoderma TaxID=669021 RepID=A0AAN6VU65_9PEZI|nr:nitrile-specifier protein 2 [Chaetomidium leptoderma]
MDTFKQLKRRTTDLFHSLEHSLPALPSIGSHGSSAMKGTWEKIQIPPLPRSSHSADIVAGTLYIFGGEVEPRRPVDNDMHVITLPSSGAQADYYAIKAKPAKSSAQVNKPPAVAPVREDEATPDDEEGETSTEPGETPDGKHLSEISLTTPSPAPGLNKGKGLAADPHPELPDMPAPRVGHATAVIGHRILLFGGRGGGPDTAPLNEGGRVWVFDTRTHLWSFLDPRPAAANLEISHPPARSDHSAVATSKPDTFATKTTTHHHHKTNNTEAWRDWALGTSAESEAQHGTPQRPVVGVLAERAVDADADGYGTLLIHGGRCLSTDSRETTTTADVWAFDVRSRVWQRLPDGPGPARSGAALALSRSRLYRFGGEGSSDDDGEQTTQQQQGGQLDFLELGVDSFDDQVTGGGVEAVLCARRGGKWQSLLFGKEDVGYKEVDAAAKPLDSGHADAWPGPRSAAAMEAVTVGGGREYLVLMFGKRDAPTSKCWDDVWVFQVPAEGMSLASVADTAFSVVGSKNGEGSWTRVEMGPHDDEDDASVGGPRPRGWVASAAMGDLEENGIVVFGGLSEGNQRLGDGWILRLG